MTSLIIDSMYRIKITFIIAILLSSFLGFSTSGNEKNRVKKVVAKAEEVFYSENYRDASHLYYVLDSLAPEGRSLNRGTEIKIVNR
ncbi:MAG: hypothetical protein JKY53_00650 [Flavobacteriales bacterium]|nr:hypothetical protein [Flavobacteriales bacterium]